MTPSRKLALGLVLLASGCAPPDRGVREQDDLYPTWFADTPIQVDGRLDEPAWRRARMRYSGGGRNFGAMWTLWDGEYLYVAVSSRLNGRTPGNRILLKISGGKRSLDMVVTPEGVHCRGVYSTSLRLFGSFVASTGGLAAALGRDGRTAPLSGRYRLLSGARPA